MNTPRVVVVLLVAVTFNIAAGCTNTRTAPGPRIFSNSTGQAESSRFAFFGSSAVRLDVYPLETTQPVRTPCLEVASVLDAKGQPLRGRRVDWQLDGAGSFGEIDTNGLIFWRGRKQSERQATTYTDYREHRIKRGSNPTDDVIIRPGQTWIIINSALEGDATVTVQAPSISDSEKNKAYVNCRWLDAGWRLPAPSVSAVATEQTLATSVFRLADQQPLANYRVRYRVLDGPPALFLPSQSPETVSTTDARGNAGVSLVQMTPQLGANRIAIEILRPADSPTSGSSVVVARGETRVDWLTPAMDVKVAGPAGAGIGEEIPYTIQVTNKGRIEILALTVNSPIPDDLEYVRLDPPALLSGKQLVWTLGKLPSGRTHVVKTLFKSTRPGLVRWCVTVRSAEGLKDEQCVTTQISQPGVKVAISGPTSGAVGQALAYQITVSNPTTVPVANAMVVAKFDPSLKHQCNVQSLDLKLGTLAPKEVRELPTLTLTPAQVGKQGLRVKVQADGNLSEEVEKIVSVAQPQLTVQMLGQKTRYAGLPAEWEIKVTNTGDTAVSNVTLKNRLPSQLRYERSTPAGQSAGGEVVWALGSLGPREHKSIVLVTHCEQRVASAMHQLVLNADPGVTVTEQAPVEITGVPAFRLKVKDDGDPVEVGRRVTYRIDVTNTGSLHADKVEIKAILPAELQLVPGGATGPSAAAVDGQTITFAKVDGHQPGQTLKYRIEAQAKQLGDVRFRVELRAAPLRQPVIRTESTQIYDALPPAPR